MRNFKVAAAVAVALGAGPALALSPAASNTAQIQLVISGSSALRDTVRSEMSALCVAGTLNYYTSSAKDFRAYSCQILPAASLPVQFDPSLADKTLTVYYRAEGGSVWGVAPVARPSLTVMRLNFATATCTQVAPPSAGSCTIGTYDLGTDSLTAGTGLIKAATDLGFSDEEPARFTGTANYFNAGNALGSAPTAAELGTLDVVPVIGQVFAIAVNTGAPLAGVTGLSRGDVTAIFSGVAKNWNKIPNQTKTGFLAASGIKLCKRENGSGTQLAADIFFNGTTCSKASYGFQQATSGTLTVQENNTTDLEYACINGTAGAIGLVSYDTAKLTTATSVKFLTIDGQAPGKQAAAQGNYDFWYEATANKGATINTPGKADELLVADGFIARLSDSTVMPVNDTVLALPENNTPVLPVDATRPIAVTSRGGNSCNTHQNKL